MGGEPLPKHKEIFMHCESCINYAFDEELEEYICMAAMDEDEFVSLLSRDYKDCPYYRNDDEYEVVRKQI